MARRTKLLFELPFTLDSPRLTSSEVGIARLIQRRQGSFDREITLLDTADHRLMRAGVSLEHRVVDGVGEWYLDAPGWQPWLPREHTEPLGGSGDLPDDLAFLVRPFRRHAALGAVAAVTQQRISYVIHGEDDQTLGTLRDERISIRRGGVTTARFREAVLQPTAEMSAEQRAFLTASLESVGAVPVDSFPAPLKRLGAPAVGLTDFPEPREVDKRTTLEGWVSSLFATRLRDLVRADLALRAADLARRAEQSLAETADVRQAPLPAHGAEVPAPLTVTPLLEEVATLRRQVRALAGVLQPAWREALESDLDQVLATNPDAPVGSLPERYYGVLDSLIAAVRAPQLGDHSRRRASEVLTEQAKGRVRVLAGRLDELTVSSPDADWTAAQVVARDLLESVRAIEAVAGRKGPIAIAGRAASKRGRTLGAELTRVVGLLEPACTTIDTPGDEELAALGPRAAYHRGWQERHDQDLRAQARAELVATWPEIRRTLAGLRGDR